MNSNYNKIKQDIDHTRDIVPQNERKELLAIFMIMLGFTFFSAGMWTGQKLAIGMDLWGFLRQPRGVNPLIDFSQLHNYTPENEGDLSIVLI